MKLPMALAIVLASAAPVSAASQPGCLPPGIATDALSWQTRDAQTMEFATESGSKRMGLLEVVEATDGRVVAVVWVRGEIVYVDGAPQNPESPGWVDTGLMTLNGKYLLDEPRPPCQWRRVGGTAI